MQFFSKKNLFKYLLDKEKKYYLCDLQIENKKI